MTKRILLFIVLLPCLHSFVLAQSFWIKKNGIFSFLDSIDQPVQNIVRTGVNYVPAYSMKSMTHQTALKNKTGLYILPEFTGQVYKALGSTKDSIRLIRIDSTVAFGYNGKAIICSYKDELYSFGGYGLWRRNGQLRKYSFNYHEWTSIPINEEQPFVNTNYYYDELEGIIYIIQDPFYNEITKLSPTEFNLLRFDFSTNTIKKIGKLNPDLKIYNLSKTNTNIILPSLKGSMISSDEHEFYLLRYETNEVYKLKNDSIRQYFYGSSIDFPKNIFAIGKRIYFNYSNDTTRPLRFVDISLDDFEKLDQPLYKADILPSKSLNYYIILILVLCLVTTCFYAFKRRKQVSKDSSTFPIKTLPNENGKNVVFTNMELLVIDAICKIPPKERLLTVDQINHILGLSKKTIEIQRKIRSEIINSINIKFKTEYGQSFNLIERIRSEEDRRNVFYTISEDKVKVLRTLGVVV